MAPPSSNTNRFLSTPIPPIVADYKRNPRRTRLSLTPPFLLAFPVTLPHLVQNLHQIMPAFANRVPAPRDRSLKAREARGRAVFAMTKNLHPAVIVCQLRREERALQRAFWSSSLVETNKHGKQVAGVGLAVYDRLLRCRDKLLEIICWPKPPTLRPGQQPGQEVNRAGRIDLAMAPADAVEVPLSPPAAPSLDSAVPPSAPSPS